MGDRPDLYGLLGVERDATPEQLKAAYRSRAKELHPDTRPDDPEAPKKFRELEEAYRVLANAESRKVYDETGEYDLAKVAQVDAQAFAVISNFIAQFIESHDDPNHVTFEDVIVGTCEQQLAQLNAKIPMINRKIAKAERLKKMTKRREGARGDDLVMRAIEHKLRADREALKQVDLAVAVAKRAIEIMADYEFEREMFITFSMTDLTTSSTGGFFHGR